MEFLIQNEEKFRTLAETVPCMLWMTDADGTPSYFNRQWCNFCGITMEQAIADWGSTIHPDDQHEATERFLAAVSHRKEFQAEYRLRRYDGQYRDMLATGVPRYDDSGSVVGYVGYVVDISEHKDAKDRLIGYTQSDRTTI